MGGTWSFGYEAGYFEIPLLQVHKYGYPDERKLFTIISYIVTTLQHKITLDFKDIV